MGRARAAAKGDGTQLTVLLLSVAGDAQLALGQHDDAAASYAAALAQSRRLGETMPAPRAQAGLGPVASAQDDLDSARRHLLAALDQIESVGVAQSEMRATFFGESQSSYDLALDILSSSINVGARPVTPRRRWKSASAAARRP